MCGIFALFLNRPLRQEDINLGRRGVRLQAHRGPDADGEWLDGPAGIYFGHTRLSIIDLSEASNQPMQRDGTVLTYNGEIYNYRHLQNDLKQRGTEFQSQGDAEVLLRAWQTYGEKALDRIDGMFAFALRDGDKNYLAVDPFGEKHLFVAETDDGIYVASELRTLVELLEPEPDTDAKLWPPFLALGYLEIPNTGFKRIKRLPPATLMRIERGRIVDEREYWQWPLGEVGRGPVAPLNDSDLDRIQDALATSLQARLISDVPLALFLSAGVDSSLIAALSSRVLGEKLDTLTVSFTDSQINDEAPRAKKIAEYLSLDHTTISSERDDTNMSPNGLMELFEQPVESLTAFSIRQISAAAATRVKVAITGMGGDEITFGYGKHAHVFEKSNFYDQPEWARRLSGLVATPLSRIDKRFDFIAHNVGALDHERLLAIKNAPTLNWLRSLPNFNAWAKHSFPSMGRSLAADSASFEIESQMPGLRLLSFDVASMRESIELRTPFLSRALAESVAEFDPRAFMAFGQKSILRRILGRFLPSELADSPKQGFVFPQSRFLNALSDEMPRSTPFDTPLVQSAWQNRHEGRGWSRVAVRLALLSTFLERHG